LLFGLYYFTRIRQKFHLPLYILSLAGMILLSLLWLANAGSNGPVTYIYFAILAFFIFVHTGRTRIIMVSLLMGFDGYYSKPVNVKELLDGIKKFLPA